MIASLCSKNTLRSWSVLFVVASAAVVTAAAPAASQSLDFSRPLDRGGSIGVYAGRVAASGTRPHVIAGDCMSACTMWLAKPNTCVMPDAVLWFHAAQDRWARFSIQNPWRTMSAAGSAAVLRTYPPRVRAVVAPWLQTPEFHTLTGTQLAALGVPLCRSAQAAANY